VLETDSTHYQALKCKYYTCVEYALCGVGSVPGFSMAWPRTCELAACWECKLQTTKPLLWDRRPSLVHLKPVIVRVGVG
jgi:hypothetical protein